MSTKPITRISESMVGPSNEKMKRQRASKPKVKTGCKTCRLRRVKCDEAKPACHRCINSGRDCDGYRFSMTPFRHPAVEFQSSFGTFLATSRQTPLRTLALNISFRTDVDKLYFDSFKKDIIPSMTSTTPSNHRLWNIILLQACHDEPWVLDSVIAIAALYISTRMSQKRTRNLYWLAASDHHQQTALERYGQAIRAMKLTLTNEERNLRKVLIGCMLVFTFEYFQGRQKQADLHVHSGYQILKRWLESKSYGTPVFQIINPSQISAVVEQDLINFFAKLHMQTISTVRDTLTSKALICEQEELDGDAILSNMPARFSDLEEVKRYLFLTVRRGVFFFAIAADVRSPPEPSPPSSESPSQDNISPDSSSNSDFAAMIHTPFQTNPVPPRITIGHQKHAIEISRLQESLNRHLTSNSTPRPLAVIVSIQLMLDTIRIWLYDLIVTEECAFDKCIDQYRRILGLAKECLKVAPPPENEVHPLPVEMPGILPSLYMVCKFCRDGQVRREAISMMGIAPRREGSWDRVLSLRISTWLMDMEEEGAIDGYIP